MKAKVLWREDESKARSSKNKETKTEQKVSVAEKGGRYGQIGVDLNGERNFDWRGGAIHMTFLRREKAGQMTREGDNRI